MYKVEYLNENYHDLTEINKRIFFLRCFKPRIFIIQPTCTSIEIFKIACNSSPGSLQSRHISHWATSTLVPQKRFYDFQYLLRPFTFTRPEITQHKLSPKGNLCFSEQYFGFHAKAIWSSLCNISFHDKASLSWKLLEVTKKNFLSSIFCHLFTYVQYKSTYSD
jgi:hypothetical protein